VAARCRKLLEIDAPDIEVVLVEDQQAGRRINVSRVRDFAAVE
jgi:hypothetical protein